uniref:Uncharacterized protein n=1 Tax=Ciona intestinalis TaxID=7719 RepID=F6S0X7_CIOIN
MFESLYQHCLLQTTCRACFLLFCNLNIMRK